jgi:hypothetical protein
LEDLVEVVDGGGGLLGEDRPTGTTPIPSDFPVGTDVEQGALVVGQRA